MNTSSFQHRIGAVAALSGVSVPTLRSWETRHGAFAPVKSSGQHRLYSDEDVRKATLLKQLTGAGHSIGTLAQLSAEQLGALLHRQRSPRPQVGESQVPSHPPAALAVVNALLASRFQSARFPLNLAESNILVTDVLGDLPQIDAQPFKSAPTHLCVRLNSLHVHHQQSLQRLVARYGIRHVLVLYSYAPERVIAALKLAGIEVRRDPVTDAELAEWLQRSLPENLPQGSGPWLGPIPQRRYSDQTLATVAGLAAHTLCECPRHVAELITQLAHFEAYSRECLDRSPQDAQLHAYLSAVSGSARALFEQALQRVAQHEGIALDEDGGLAGQGQA
jgi:MerR family transcriptional regulator, light-induced transcriptional regulator